jgi:serine/threonine protein kinase
MRPPDIAGFEYRRELARGGHSVVLLYRQLSPARDVAVKVIQVGAATGRVAEADAMARLGMHANIVPVFATGFDGASPYIVMAYCPGEDLWTLVRRGPFDVRKVLRIGVQIADAVQAAHALGIVHHDIKPANILTDEFRVPRLTDFGVAGLLAGDPDTGQVAVSLPWAPPEILRGDRGGPAADVYALGATLWNLLAGRSPFERPGDNSAAAMESRILAAQAPPTGRADVPADLERLLAAMLAKSPAARPASAQEVAQRLERIETRLGGPVRADAPWHPPSAVPTLPQPATVPEEADVLTRTHIRRAGPDGRLEPLPDQTVRKPRATPPAAVETPSVRRLRWPVAVGVAAAAALTLAVAFAVTGADDDPGAVGAGPDPTVDAGRTDPVQDAGAQGDAVPPGTPTVAAARTDPGHLRFTWTYSAPYDSDTFRWRTADGSRSGDLADAALDLDAPAGAEVCVQVKVIRVDGANAAVDWSPPGCGR